MNKTININLVGVIFSIEEDAYEKLKDYIDLLKAHFDNKQGQEEIINDIEARFAELFKEQLDNKNLQVVDMAIVQNCINKMGLPEDFEDEDLLVENTNEFKNEKPKRRLFRNTDDHILGGVCSGITNYFGFNDPVWLRIAFVLLAIFSGGTIILGYLLLWIIVPEAKLPFEKLAMKGEPINVSNIERAVVDEIEGLKKNISSNEYSTTSFKSFVKRLWNGILDVIKLVFSFVFKISKGFLAVIASIIIVGLIIALLTGGFAATTSIPFAGKYVFGSMFSASVWSISFLIFYSIILIGLIYLFTLLIKQRKKPFDFGGKGKAIAGLGVFAFLVWGLLSFSLTKNFNEIQFSEKQLNFEQPESDTLHIDIVKSDYERYKHKINHNIKYDFSMFNVAAGNDVTELDGSLVGKINLDIEPSENEYFELIQVAQANGKTTKEATKHAENISVDYLQNNNEITFVPFYKLGENAKIRGQEADLVLKVPLGKFVFIKEDVKKVIYKLQNTSGLKYNQFHNHLYVMGKEGLACIDCKSANMDLDSRASKHLSSTEWNFENFNEIVVKGPLDIEIINDDNYSVEVFTEKEESIENLKITQRDEELTLTLENNKKWKLNNNLGKIEVKIKCPILKKLDAAGASDIVIKGFEQELMEIEISGASDCEAQIQVDNFEASISGASGLKLDGSINDADIYVSGASSLNAFLCPINDADIRTTGASSAKVYVKNELDAEAYGASSIVYKGNPVDVEKDSAGASSISKQ